MRIDKLKIYTIELSMIIVLFFALFASNIFTRGITSILLFAIMFITLKFVNKRGTTSIYQKQVTVFMIIFSLIYLSIFYLIGLNTELIRSKITFSWWTFKRYIVPLTLIIVSSELTRERLITQKLKENIKGKKINISAILIFIAMILVDFIVYVDAYNLSSLDDFLTILGFVLFSSISSNLLFNYMSLRFGSTGIIIFRLITTLFFYIFPYKPDFYILFRVFLRMLYPYIIYILLERNYAKTKYAISYTEKRKSFAFNTTFMLLSILVIMLVSCNFKYGMLVIGSNSMRGSINMGDAIVYTTYDDTLELKPGDVIVFNKNNIQTVHRIEKIKNINNVNHYYTRGDANKSPDKGFITNEQIIGKVNIKIKFIGYPTLWVRRIFNQ